jgi:hypothetical protein
VQNSPQHGVLLLLLLLLAAARLQDLQCCHDLQHSTAQRSTHGETQTLELGAA